MAERVGDACAAGGFTIGQLVDALANFPANGKPPVDDLHLQLVILGYIQEHKVDKSCPTCGAPRVDYRYMKLTQGGRLFLAAARQNTPGKDHHG